MGQSTDALIAFGFDLGEDIEDFDVFTSDDEDLGIDEIFDAHIGVVPYKEPGWVSHDEDEKIRAAAPAELIRHCSGDYPMYFLAVPGTKKLARRGYPEAIDPGHMEVPAEKVSAFLEWCTKHGIEVPEEGPHWHLFSDWG